MKIPIHLAGRHNNGPQISPLVNNSSVLLCTTQPICLDYQKRRMVGKKGYLQTILFIVEL